MQRYNPSEIEPKWQRIWADAKLYEVSADAGKRKTYAANMFPYPSGTGLHAGHILGYSLTDTIARYHRQHGHNVLQPLGWDAFGLPAENYAIKTGKAPSVSTKENIAKFKEQVQRIGISIDWSREINTSDPEYYRWTQWIFTKLFERGLAYQDERAQWWCPECKTVLANEQVINGGYCWRHEDTLVIKKKLKQWFFKITEYADQLLEGLDDLDWPDKIKTMQRNWIGRSVGAEIAFAIAGAEASLRVFTTRPDTIYGATFLVVAPEHPMIEQMISSEQRHKVESYIQAAVRKSDVDRMETNREKTGVFTGSYAINPATGEQVPIWVADYVLMGYGTGAIMAVPAHDERDYEFAKVFDLPIVDVYERPGEERAFGGEGIIKNSDGYDGLRTEEMRERIVADLSKHDAAEEKVHYRMRDWLISRQRYWGAPIPIIHCPKDGPVAVPERDLPVVLPEVESYAPDGSGKSVLARVDEWVNVPCPQCGEPAKRETDTMDGYACSSWYLLRYTDPRNDTQAWDPAIANYWSPLDYYVGGDHAVAHLLYVRFWTRVFHDMGLTDFQEPVTRLVYHGYINAEDGSKMSKSKGNVVDPLDIIDQGYGADALRTYVLFMGPIELDASWDTKGLAGVYRFLSRVWTLAQEHVAAAESVGQTDEQAIRQIIHRTIKKVDQDLESLDFNTAIAALMSCVNDLYKEKTKGAGGPVWRESLESLSQLLAPFAPHMASELWEQFGHTDSIHAGHWPVWEEQYLIEDTVTIAVQVNGKVRAEIQVAKDASQADVEAAALSDSNVMQHTGGKEPARIIFVPGRLVNIVVKG